MLAFAVGLLRTAAVRRVLAVVATWLGGFALAVLIAYTLNWLLNGHFRLQLASWRHPNPLTSFQALVVNAGRWFTTVGELWAAQWWLGLIALAGVVLGWRDATVRPRLQRLLVVFAVALGMDAFGDARDRHRHRGQGPAVDVGRSRCCPPRCFWPGRPNRAEHAGRHGPGR